MSVPLAPLWTPAVKCGGSLTMLTPAAMTGAGRWGETSGQVNTNRSGGVYGSMGALITR